jgi:poly[(R)-3-hydroxyalkanoate] polymerase subunit PhaE
VTTNPFEYMQGLAALWGRGAGDFAAQQQTMFRDMAERMAKAAEGAPGALPAGMPDAEGLMAAQREYSRLWTSALEVSQTVGRAVQEGAPPDPLVADMLGKIFDPRLWFSGTNDMDGELRRLAEGPQLADLWQVERRALNVFNAWGALRRRSLEHNTVMLDAWLKAAAAFAKELNQKAERGEVLESWRAVLALWVETANTALLETQRTDAYLQSQRNMLTASTELRLAQQEVAEFYSQMFGYPTRAELDDVYKTVTELRREVRALQRAARQSKQPGPAKRSGRAGRARDAAKVSTVTEGIKQ